MQRHEMIDAMRGLGLKGMAGAFDDAVTAGVQRKRTVTEILSDLLRAEGAHRHAASIRYRMTAAKLPVVKDLDAFVFENTPINEGLVRSLHAGSFLPGRRKVVLVGGTGTGKTHLACAIAASVIRAGARGRCSNTVDLVTQLEVETPIAVDLRNTRWCSDGLEITCDNSEKVRVAFALDCCDREAMGYVATTGGITAEDVQDLMVATVEHRYG